MDTSIVLAANVLPLFIYRYPDGLIYGGADIRLICMVSLQVLPHGSGSVVLFKI